MLVAALFRITNLQVFLYLSKSLSRYVVCVSLRQQSHFVWLPFCNTPGNASPMYHQVYRSQLTDIVLSLSNGAIQEQVIDHPFSRRWRVALRLAPMPMNVCLTGGSCQNIVGWLSTLQVALKGNELYTTPVIGKNCANYGNVPTLRSADCLYLLRTRLLSPPQSNQRHGLQSAWLMWSTCHRSSPS